MCRSVVWGVLKVRATLFRGPTTEDYNMLGSALGPPFLGNYHVFLQRGKFGDCLGLKPKLLNEGYIGILEGSMIASLHKPCIQGLEGYIGVIKGDTGFPRE